MKHCLVALCLLAVAAAETDLEQWQAFKDTHGKLYNNHIEESQRYAVFQSNLRKIEEHNARYDAGGETYFLKVNKFADMSQEEFSQMLRRSYGKGSIVNATATYEGPLDADVPDSFDWRTHGAVVGIKDQGECGGCWAFAAAAVTESAYYIKNKKLVSFSEQQVLDCTQDTHYQQAGCDGGLEQIGLQYIVDKGIETEQKYPFKGVDVSRCEYQKSDVYAQLKKVVQVPSLNHAALKVVVATVGPTTVAIDADYIQLYGGGVYSGTQCGNTEEKLNHAMTNIGYGTANGVDYWLIKNSWGTIYGENGYIRMRRGINQCGVERDNFYGTF